MATDDLAPPVFDVRVPVYFWVIGAGHGSSWMPREDLQVSLSEASAIMYARDLARMSEIHHEARRFAVRGA